VEGAPRARALGRILSLGYPLPGPRVDNFTFVSAPSFSDYDAMVVNPLALSELIEKVCAGEVEVATYAGRRVRNSPEAPGEASLSAVLLRRRDETLALLQRGGAVIAFASPPALHAGIAGIGPLDSWYWLGERAPALTAAEGSELAVVDFQHPLAAFAHGQLGNTLYRATLPPESGACGVFVRTRGGAPAAAELQGGPGRIVLLPALKAPPAGDARYRASDVMQSGIRRLLGAMAEGRPPAWMTQFPLPGLEDRAAAVAAARTDADAARKRVEDAEREHEELARYQQLLWQEGPSGLDDIVVSALKLIGCDVYDRTPDAIEARIDGTQVLIEIDAAEHAVELAAHYRLRQRMEDAIARRAQSPRGLLVINGYRLLPPKERPAQVSDALRAAAETMRYALAPTTGLYAAVGAKLAGDVEAAAAYRRRLVTEEGLLT
jgi:hypothetical protein